MKKLFALVLGVSLALSALAGEVTLSWNASITPGVTNYVLVAVQGTNVASVSVGTNLILKAKLDGVVNFTVLAEKDGVRSDPSDGLTLESPVTPGALRVVIQNALTINSTNWNDVGFFRLRIADHP